MAEAEEQQLTGLAGNREKMDQAIAWLRYGTEDQKDAAIDYLDGLRAPCPEGCGCRLSLDRRGNHDADARECGCDGPCTGGG